MAHGLAADVGFCNLAHFNGCLHPGGNAGSLKRALQRQRVHHCGKHAHVIGPGSVHVLAGAPPPKVAAADNNGNFNPRFPALLYHSSNGSKCVGVQPGSLAAGQRLAAHL